MSITTNNTVFLTSRTYLSKVDEGVITVTRPANAATTTYTYPLRFTATDYTPELLGYWQDPFGRWHMSLSVWDSTFGLAGYPYAATVLADRDNLTIVTIGSASDANVYTFSVKYFIFLISVSDDL